MTTRHMILGSPRFHWLSRAFPFRLLSPARGGDPATRTHSAHAHSADVMSKRRPASTLAVSPRLHPLPLCLPASSRWHLVPPLPLVRLAGAAWSARRESARGRTTKPGRRRQSGRSVEAQTKQRRFFDSPTRGPTECGRNRTHCQTLTGCDCSNDRPLLLA